MPSGPRSTSRPGAGPGRGPARARSKPRGDAPPATSGGTTSSTATSTADPVDAPVTPAAPPAQTPTGPFLGRRSSITTRAIALAVVLLILTISYASSLRIYFAQAEKISATRVDIAARQERIAELETQLRLWDDPAFVRQQARERLGWVVPGEIGFRVIGPDGKPLGGGAEIGKPAPAIEKRPVAWWQRLKGSVQTADRPAPTAQAPKKAAEKPITENTEPR